MPKKPDTHLIAALDLGTSKVVAMVGEIQPNGRLNIIGIGTHPARGMKKGVIVNIDATVQAVQKAIEEAEYMAGCQIHSVYVGIAGSHIRSFNSHGIVAIQDREITALDIERVIDAAKAVVIPNEQKMLHVLPQEFIIDNQEGIQDPISMSGVRLEAKVHVVTGSVSAAQNIVTCVRRCGLEVEDMVLEQLASGYAVLTEDEKQLGVCLIDIGGGTTDIAVFVEGAIRHTAVIPVAGDQVNHDIAVALRTPTHSAEQIKIQFGCALTHMAQQEEIFDIPLLGEDAHKTVSHAALSEVIEPRFEELFALVQAELRYSRLEHILHAGMVITGGSARMEGVIELAETVFEMPVRLGMPRHVSGLVERVQNPIYATGVGLLQYGLRSLEQHQAEGSTPQGFKAIFGRMKHWFHGSV